LTGGVRRALKYRATWYWVAFLAWMIIATFFSSWQGGSAARVYDYARVSFLLVFIVGGMAATWKEVRAVFFTIAAAGFVNLLSSRLFSSDSGGRISLQSSGTIGNSNDLAAHLLLVLPFILYLVMDRKIPAVFRYTLLAPIAYGIWVILGTASRGALVALAVVFLYLLWSASPVQRILTLVAVVTIAASAFAFLPSNALTRLGSLFGEEHQEAKESGESRSYLFRTSVQYTLEHPLFGVGPDQFANFEGKERVSAGQIGSWHATHCAWTQISSECGIPALIFAVLGIGSAFEMVRRTRMEAKKKGFTDIANACFCYLIAMVGFLVAITFLANAYRYYLPAMIGLAMAIRSVSIQYMARTTPQAPQLPQTRGRIPSAYPSPAVATR
jgi:O-antigen ligase